MENKCFDLSIIILNFNGRNWLEKLLPSLEKQYLQKTDFQVEVIVVDNASTDDSVSYLQSFEWIRLIETEKNGGFAYGNNRALKDNPARYVMLLNNDTELTEDNSNLDILIEYMDAHEKVGIMTPAVNLTNGSPDKACHRGEPTPWAAFTYLTGLERLFPGSRLMARYHQCYKNFREIHTIDACTGAAMMIRSSAMKKVGLLDELFFMYAEDLDWCRRFREAGYLVVYHPAVTIIHHKYQSGIRNTNQTKKSETIGFFYDAMLLYYDKYYKNRRYLPLRCLLKCFILFRKNIRPGVGK